MDDLFEHMISSLSEDIGNAGRSCLVSDTWGRTNHLLSLSEDIGNAGRSCLDSNAGGQTNCSMTTLQGSTRVSTHLQGQNSYSNMIANKNNLLVYNEPQDHQDLHDQDMLCAGHSHIDIEFPMGGNTRVSLQPCQQVYWSSLHSPFYF